MAKTDGVTQDLGDKNKSSEDRLEIAIELQQKWLFDEARLQYEEILKKNPDDANAHHNIGVLFSVQLLQPMEALKHFEAALNINPTKLQFWFSYIDALIKVGAVDVAEHVLALASNYGLNDLQISSFERDIRLARTTVADLVSQVLSGTDPLPKFEKNINSKVESEKNYGDPSIADLQRLLSLFNQKKYDRVCSSIKKLIHSFPKSPTLWKLLGESERRMGSAENALEAYKNLANLMPNDTQAQMDFINILILCKKHVEAEAVLNDLLCKNPGFSPAYGKLGILYQHQGKIEEALYSYAKCLNNDYYDPIILEKFGALLRIRGDQDGALVCFKAAVEASPNSAELQHAYGITLLNQERLAAAENAFRSALKIHPGYTPALRSLCHLLELHGRFAEAEAGLLRCAEIDNESPESLYEIGRNLVQQKKEDEALEWLRRAIKAQPDYAAAHITLSAALNATEDPLAAMEEIKASIKVLPNIPHLHTNLGIVNLSLSRADDAIACFRKALEIAPNFSHARSSMLFALSHSTKITPEELYREHRAYGKLIEEEVKGKEYTTYTNSRVIDRPLKIGFVSADFRNHAVAQFVIPFFEELHKREGFITYAYSNHGAVDDSMLRIKENMDVWRTVVQWSDDKLAEKIREDQIDILVDMSGHTAGDRLKVFARHPAPVQITWIGYPGTTGLKAMDYKFLNALYLKPDGAENFHAQFTEKLVLYPPSFTFKKNQEKIDVGPAPCLKNGYLTFGSFNRLNKISHEVVSVWCQIMRAIPDARLIMGAMPSNGAPEEVVQWFEAEGVSLDRVFFYPRTGLSEYLKLHEQVDLCLDTFPYTGGTTTLHALWLGVPTLTIAGDTVSGRQSSANLHSVGLGEVCVARDLSGLLELAQAWSKKPELLNKVRRNLQAAYAAQDEISSPEVMVKSIVYAMRRMWMLWCSGQKPKSLMISNQDISLNYLNNFFEAISLNDLLN